MAENRAKLGFMTISYLMHFAVKCCGYLHYVHSQTVRELVKSAA
jgi:hypothetical protein